MNLDSVILELGSILILPKDCRQVGIKIWLLGLVSSEEENPKYQWLKKTSLFLSGVKVRVNAPGNKAFILSGCEPCWVHHTYQPT